MENREFCMLILIFLYYLRKNNYICSEIINTIWKNLNN